MARAPLTAVLAICTGALLLAASGCERDEKRSDDAPTSPGATDGLPKPDTPEHAFERFRLLGRRGDTWSMWEMVAEEGRRTFKADLQAQLAQAPPELKESLRPLAEAVDTLEGRELFDMVLQKGKLDFDGLCLLSTEVDGDDASMTVLAASAYDAEISQIRFRRESGTWKVSVPPSPARGVKSPRPTVSPASVYRASLVLRDRGDWEAFVSLMDTRLIDSMADSLRPAIAKQAADPAVAKRLAGTSSRDLVLLTFRTGQRQGSAGDEVVTREQIDGSTALVTVKKRTGDEQAVALRWIDGVWKYTIRDGG